jgi:hypothetical protein
VRSNSSQDGGVPRNLLRVEFDRAKVEERGPFVVWGFRPDHTTADRGLARPFFTGQFTTRDDGTRLDAGWDASLWPYAVARLPSVNLPPLLRWPREHPAPRETSWLCWAVIPIHGWQPFSFEFPAKNKDPSQGASARAPLG